MTIYIYKKKVAVIVRQPNRTQQRSKNSNNNNKKEKRREKKERPKLKKTNNLKNCGNLRFVAFLNEKKTKFFINDFIYDDRNEKRTTTATTSINNKIQRVA